MKTARAAAVLTWIYAAAFGLPAIPISAYLMAEGHLPTFMGLFETYGGPWSARVESPNLRRPTGGFPRGDNPGRLISLVAMAGQKIRRCSQPRPAADRGDLLARLRGADSVALRHRSGRTARGVLVLAW